jgi:transcriptional antiterminator NusG
MLADIAWDAPKTKMNIHHEVGDQMKVLDGLLASFTSLVEELSFDSGRVKVGDSIVAHATPVELDFASVERGK